MRARRLSKERAAFLLGTLWVFVCCQRSNDQLLRELSDPSISRRAGAVRVLWRLDDAEAYRLATRALDDEAQAVRLAAVRALADFKRVDTLAALVRASRQPDPEVRRLAAEKIAERGSEEATEALLGLLALREEDAGNRRRLSELLLRRGMTESALWAAVANRLVRLVRQDWPSLPAAKRAAMARLAGRSVDDDGLQVLEMALDDTEVEVVGAAVSVLEGRGGLSLTRKLYRLMPRLPVALQLSVLQELMRRGAEGVELVRGGLYSPDEHVRLTSLRLLLEAGAPLSSSLVCECLRQVPIAPAIEVLEAMKGKTTCSSEQLLALWEAAPPGSKHLAARLLLALGTDAEAEKILAPGDEEQRLQLAVARAKAGVADPRAVSFLRRQVERLLGETERSCASWVGGRILPLPKSESEEQRLDEESLRKLFEKHNLPAPSPTSPRGVSDLLAGVSDRRDASFYQKLFEPAAAEALDELFFITETYLKVEPESGKRFANRLLRLPSPKLAARAAQTVLAAGRPFALEKGAEDNLIAQLSEADEEGSEFIARLLIGNGGERSLLAVLEEVKRSAWGKRQRLLGALVGDLRPETSKLLQTMLAGEAAAHAAMVLAANGAREAVPAIRQALTKASPGAEIPLLEALAKLGDQSISERLELLLYHPDPELRLKVVDILAYLPAETREPWLQRAALDPDRLVRRQARETLAKVKVEREKANE